MLPQHLLIRTAPQLGQQLLAARKARKLTQGAVAAKVGVAQSRISDLEKRPGEISLEQLLAWCAVLGLELSIRQRGPGTHADTETHTKADW